MYTIYVLTLLVGVEGSEWIFNEVNYFSLGNNKEWTSKNKIVPINNLGLRGRKRNIIILHSSTLSGIYP